VPGPLAIAQVSPRPWEDADREINRQVRGTAEALAARGHRVVVVAPSRSSEAVRETRQALRSAGASVLPEPGAPPRVLAVGEVLPEITTARRAPSLPVDVARTIEHMHDAVPLDVCHVHEPFAPSTSSAALRHSRALNVGTFHVPTERILSTQLARRVVELVFGRLDARLASYAATAELLGHVFPAEYRVVRPAAEAAPPPAAQPGAPLHVVVADEEERGALRLALRALRRVDPALRWRVTVLTDRGPSLVASLRADVRARVEVVPRAGRPLDALLAGADVVVAASDGAAPAPHLLLAALAAGAVPVVARLPVYEELVGEGDRGLLFEPRDVDVLGAQLTRLAGDAELRERLRRAASGVREELGFERLTDELEDVYGGLVARRHAPPPDGPVRRRVLTRALIDVDLHMHTDHSPDCATPVEVLLATARAQGLGAIAVTDHNEVSGALDAAEKAAEFGVKVIVGEEVKTASQGEVIGLFLSERIPRGLTLEDTVAEIRRQGGLVYVPHPFDRMHAVPDYEHLLAILDDVDAIEVYNPRVAIGAFNEEAARFAAKYRVLAGAGSDAHVAQGLGSVRVRMPDFHGPEEFLAALAEAEIVTRPSSLLYVQALKFLQTKATPPGARRASRERRVRRATRNA
jgi:predicted metal-dependent phosphoesterase TrpH/glycosyltransferase involved in cell wall biosynthesis